MPLWSVSFVLRDSITDQSYVQSVSIGNNSLRPEKMFESIYVLI